ncbi:hypothetical protein E2562_003064 [Oryza meyeriana var. granulata]|uniref:Uncharacterized protein n=1 Tax=Oryza meyeriana var. granulata TaxID=110450 RepID=A0A6G1EBE2_9ORYZ|nr:hypothetical protein E2562_003064 [Oryza meyeriana var. granulata]
MECWVVEWMGTRWWDQLARVLEIHIDQWRSSNTILGIGIACCMWEKLATWAKGVTRNYCEFVTGFAIHMDEKR